MSDIAIKVENLSKRYRIGLKEELHDTFAGALTDFFRQPVKNMRCLTTFSDDGQDEDECYEILERYNISTLALCAVPLAELSPTLPIKPSAES